MNILSLAQVPTLGPVCNTFPSIGLALLFVCTLYGFLSSMCVYLDIDIDILLVQVPAPGLV